LRFDAAGAGGRLPPFSAELPHGRRVAVTGAPGSGKSTLLALAARLLDPDTGRVCLGGHALASLDGQALRRAVGVVAADALLVRGTVRQNLQQRRPEATDRALAAVAALTGWADAGPALFALPVSDAGANLNGELRREIAWAAALVGQPAVLLIDDAERALPGPSATRLQAFLRRYPGSVLFSTADPTLAALADEVWTLPAATAGRQADAPTPPVAGRRLRLVAADRPPTARRRPGHAECP
jgi:ABC-type bacteriocin/lantibiotic exporter with double-glycine peptidase domain